MPNLKHRLAALETDGKAKTYLSAAEMPDEYLLELTRPVFGGRTPTDDELEAYVKSNKEAAHATT
jgi:hypothetical protein